MNRSTSAIKWDENNYRGDAYSCYSWAADVAEVEIDLRTYAVRVTDFVAVQEVGKVLNPTLARGQIQGGVAQGIGWALNEEFFYTENGTVANSSFLDYRMPTSLDLPMIDTVIIEVPNPEHPYGVRGVGETPIGSPPAASCAAIYHATGVRFRELPMSPQRVCAAILQKQSKK